MNSRYALAAMIFLLLVAVQAPAQSIDTGAISGRVVDQQGGPLRGAAITLSSASLMGTRSFSSEADGGYRFPALPPGVYSLRAELPGFKTVSRENVRLTTTTRLTVDIPMEKAAAAEEVTVIGRAPSVDVKSSETASVTLSNEILRNIPYSQFTPDIVHLAPGVTTDNVAFGGSANTGIAYTLDGVNVADPEAGLAWVFLDHNIVQEAKVMAVGAPAEYGNFTGVIFNLVTKSGGNTLSGHFEADFQGKKTDSPKGFWQAENNGAFVEDFPGLTSSLLQLFDVSAHLGGPIKKDRLWFYAGLQWYNEKDYPTDFPEAQDYNEPRSFFKLTSETSPTTNLNVSLEVDTYNGTNQAVFGYDYSQLGPGTTLTQKSPEVVANFSLTHIASPTSFFDFKGAFFWGNYHLNPVNGMDVAARFSIDDNKWYDNAYHYGYFDRSRFQANASFTQYVEDFISGSHDFKFGVEIERSYVHNRFGYTGPDHTYYIESYGEPYLAYQYEGYDTKTYSTRLEAFAQDSWEIGKRLNINAGLRFSQNWGTVRDVEGVVYKTWRLAPRIGFAFDLFGDKSTVLKAHYGQFTEALRSGIYARLNPASAFSDFIAYAWENGEWVEMFTISPEDGYTMAEGIKHPYLDQFSVGIERELFKDASVGITYINRQWRNIIGMYDLMADYEPYSVVVSELDKSYEIYQRTEDSVDTYEYVIDNIKKGQPWISSQPYRKYWGVEFLFNKRFSNRWQLLLSYVYSQATGTIDNEYGHDIGWSERDGLTTADPNYWINANGHSTYDPTHMLKIQGTYILPFDISLSAYFRAITGNAWTTRYQTEALNQGRVTFFTEPRGSNHYDVSNLLDLRLEKVFTLAGRYRLGLIVDVFNVFNADTITSWGTILGFDSFPDSYPSTQGHELYGLVRPRQARVGIRLIF